MANPFSDAFRWIGKFGQRPGEAEQRQGLTNQAGAASSFAGSGEAGFGRMGGELDAETARLRALADGTGPSIAGERLRQGLQQAVGAQQSFAASAAPRDAAMAGMVASRNAMGIMSGAAGQTALAEAEERAAAQRTLVESLMRRRQQELDAALGSRQNATNAYGAVQPGQSWLDRWAGPVMGAAQLKWGGEGKG